ncbi:MAG TPA: hypothetical protein VEA38_16725 [Terriglobales bacterium]|nr:hypothetical protein [Terriglobales bacterium]
MRIATAALLASLVLTPVVAQAQAEDRRRAPTSEAAAAAGSASADPCGPSAAMNRGLVAGPVTPGFDPRMPAPQGATSFTGIAPPSRDPSRQVPLPAPNADVAYQQDCVRPLR